MSNSWLDGVEEALPGENVGIVRAREGLLQLLQLITGESSAVTTLLPFGGKLGSGVAGEAGHVDGATVVLLFLLVVIAGAALRGRG